MIDQVRDAMRVLLASTIVQCCESVDDHHKRLSRRGLVVLLAAAGLGYRPRSACLGGVRLQRRRTLGPRLGGA
jgi:hypothetical protein